MTFTLDTEGAAQQSGNGGGGNTVDFDALNLHVIEAVGTQAKAKTVVGFVSGMYDLGMQPRPDYEELYDAANADQAKALEAGEARIETKNYYDNSSKKWHNDAEVFCKPRTPAKAFALSVDFPQYVVDKAPFFGGESQPLPLRLIMGGTWSVKNPDVEDRKMPIVQNPFYLTENTNNEHGVWSISNLTTLYKMGDAAGLVDEEGLFPKEKVSQLLGKALMFKIRVHNKASKKDASKSFYTEEVKFVSEVPEGLPVPEFDTTLIHGLNMKKANNPEFLQQTRAVIKNTMRLSTDWETSVIKGEIEAQKAERKVSNTQAKTKGPEEDNTPDRSDEPSGGDGPFDDDIPFNYYMKGMVV